MTRPAITPSVIGCQQRRAEAGPAADSHPGREEREHRHRETRRQRPHGVFEQFCGRRAVAPEHRHRESQDNARDGGVHTAGVHQCPRGDGQRHQ